MFRNIQNYCRLGFHARTNEQGVLKSREHEMKTLKFTLKLLHKDPMLESCWTRKGLNLFEELYTDRMFKNTLLSLSRDRPESLRMAAVTLLGELGNTEAVDYLFSIVHGKNEKEQLLEKKQIRFEAINALGKIGGKEALDRLMYVLWTIRELRGSVLENAIANAGGSISGKEME